MIQWLVDLPIWEMIRITGIVSYLLLFLGIILGILYGYPLRDGQTKAKVFKLHKLSTNTGTLLAIFHGIFPVISTYIPFSWSEILIPFAAKRDTVLYGLGTLAIYGLLILIFTSDFRHKIRKPFWYIIHLLSYPIFGASLIHGVMLGTESSLLWVRWMYVLTALIIVLVTLGRFARADGMEGKAVKGKSGSVQRRHNGI